MPDDNRQMQRFPIAIPADIEPIDGGEGSKLYLNLISRDVCAGGAFFLTAQPLKSGTQVMVNMFLKHVHHTIETTSIKISGTIIRTEQKGMAVRFDKNYKIIPI
jgi:hypothetical protein